MIQISVLFQTGLSASLHVGVGLYSGVPTFGHLGARRLGGDEFSNFHGSPVCKSRAVVVSSCTFYSSAATWTNGDVLVAVRRNPEATPLSILTKWPPR